MPWWRRTLVGVRQRSLVFTAREYFALIAFAGVVLCAHVTVFAFATSDGRLALLGAGGIAMFFILHMHFADVPPEPDLGPPSGMTAEELDRLIDEVDRLQGVLPERPRHASTVLSADDDDFTELVRDALEELPEFMQRELHNVAIIVSDDGRTFHASGQRLYGCHVGGNVVNRRYTSVIYIFRDTLIDDFADDPDELRRQVTITVRHELAHHLGEHSERRIRDLGL
jgi:predicted Zn-dependent protease with MMP-like domain